MSVKQQLRQFETDLDTINGTLPDGYDPISGLTLVGRADVCPYARENRGGIDRENVYERCEGLRERTRNHVGDGGATTTSNLVSEAQSQQIGLMDSGAASGTNETATGDAADYLSVDGEPTPYRPDTEEFEGTEFCPFYAGFLDDLPEDGDPAEAVPFDITELGHIGPAELVPKVEVVIGNYCDCDSDLLVQAS